ncbi:LysM peptidoglycan-binding domain-containing protein [Psychromonas sp. KJ10-10]|uniref:LysM peptidoglycan-binding domain-containing protein n=1 Tax=Psychromonas sp. KJ10-10 TaxID=3391823 RepID=UPI0039B422B2
MSAFADTLTLREDHPETYTVVKGDTLWDISAYFLNTPWLWPRLWQANSQIENPHLIYPGDVLTLIWVDGEPRLTRKQLMKLSPKPRLEEKKNLFQPFHFLQFLLSYQRIMSLILH